MFTEHLKLFSRKSLHFTKKTPVPTYFSYPLTGKACAGVLDARVICWAILRFTVQSNLREKKAASNKYSSWCFKAILNETT